MENKNDSDTKFYMHINTGSIDSEENWNLENGDDFCNLNKDMIQVFLDENNKWIEVEKE